MGLRLLLPHLFLRLAVVQKRTVPHRVKILKTAETFLYSERSAEKKLRALMKLLRFSMKKQVSTLFMKEAPNLKRKYKFRHKPALRRI